MLIYIYAIEIYRSRLINYLLIFNKIVVHIFLPNMLINISATSIYIFVFRKSLKNNSFKKLKEENYGEEPF